MKVVIIGTGNVATILGKKIMAAGNEIIQVAGRDIDKSNMLAAQLQSSAVYNTKYINLTADIYIMAVSDSSVSSVACKLKLKDKIIVHTAAAVSKNVLEVSSSNFGVLYPLQTLVKQMPSLPFIPVLIDGNNETTKELLVKFSSEWADSVQFADDKERLKLHVAAMFVNNFTNYIFAITEEYCKSEQLNFSLLHPLIKETAGRLKSQSPAVVQTGPAVRKDFLTIDKHKEVLKNNPELLGLYNLFTNKILSSGIFKKEVE